MLSPNLEKARGLRPSSWPWAKMRRTFATVSGGMTTKCSTGTPLTRLAGSRVGVGEGVGVGVGLGLSVDVGLGVEKGLPEGVTFKTSYDRSTLIQEAVQSVKGTLIEEMIAVSLVVLIFLFHWRSAVIILIQLPISVAAGFFFVELFGISSNIM